MKFNQNLSNLIKYDSIFIDGNHNYADCLADIEFSKMFIKPNGIISGHDYWPKHDGVMQAVQESFKTFNIVENTRIWIGNL